MNQLTPMLNTAHLQITMDWYKSLGFKVLQTNHHWAPDQPLNWCLLELEGNRLMLNQSPERVTRNLTLNLEIADVDGLYARLGEGLAAEYPPTDQFYERRDFEVRDPNGNALLLGRPV